MWRTRLADRHEDHRPDGDVRQMPDQEEEHEGREGVAPDVDADRTSREEPAHRRHAEAAGSPLHHERDQRHRHADREDSHAVTGGS